MGDNPEAYDDIYRDISKAYKEKGNMDSAYFYLDRSATIVNRRFDKDIENFKKYKDFYVAEQQKVKEAEKKNIQQQNYGLLAGLSLLSVIGLILYRNNRQKQKVNTILENTLIKLKETQNQLIEKEKLESLAALRLQKLRIAADMHDDIGSDLSALNLKAEMIRQKVKAGKQPMSEIDGLISFTSEIAKKVREVIWTVNARHDSLSSIINYFDTYADDFFEPTNIVVRTSLPPDIPQTDINGESRKILLMCFKESLNNVLKHAHASELKIVYAVENAIFSISIQDNGLGFDPSVLIVSHTNGNGLMNMQERMASIGGQCRIQTSPQGTEIVLLLPI
jgi:signal transduction histidine kinase